MEEKYLAHKDANTGKEQTLYAHLTETGHKAKDFSAKIGLEKCGELIGLLHDIGKYSNEFQSRISGEDIDCDHSTSGSQVLNRLCRIDADGITKVIYQMMCVSLMSHHGGLIDVIDQNGSDNYSRRLLKTTDDIYKRGDNILLKAGEIANSTQFYEECKNAIRKLNIFSDTKNQEEL